MEEEVDEGDEEEAYLPVVIRLAGGAVMEWWRPRRLRGSGEVAAASSPSIRSGASSDGKVVPDLKRCGAIHTWFEGFQIGTIPTPALPNAKGMAWIFPQRGSAFPVDGVSRPILVNTRLSKRSLKRIIQSLCSLQSIHHHPMFCATLHHAPLRQSCPVHTPRGGA
jgi:hypothetical protein